MPPILKNILMYGVPGFAIGAGVTYMVTRKTKEEKAILEQHKPKTETKAA